MWAIAAKYSGVGIEMTTAVAIGTITGGWLDKKFGTTPYLFWFGVLVGFGAATQAVLRVLRDLRQQAKKNADESRKGPSA